VTHPIEWDCRNTEYARLKRENDKLIKPEIKIIPVPAIPPINFSTLAIGNVFDADGGRWLVIQTKNHYQEPMKGCVAANLESCIHRTFSDESNLQTKAKFYKTMITLAEM
jgi:hypothetical protein